MRWRIAEAVDELIDRHGLHDDGTPVDLSPIKEEFIPFIESLADVGVPAFAVPPKGGRASRDSPACVVMDSRRPEAWRRIYYAHEVGHILCGHPGSLRTLDAGAWWHNRDEREAWEAASMLLIPYESWGWGVTPDEIAGSCNVPVWLAELYPRFWS